jgi:hypothetical protein
MPTAEQLDALAKLGDAIQAIGITGGLALFGWALYTGRLRSGRDYDRAVSERDAADARLDRLSDVLEGLLGVKVAK